MDSFKVRFAHAKHSKISEYNIIVLNLMLRQASMRLSFLMKSLFPRMAPTTARPLAGIMRSFVNSTIMFLLVFSVIQ